MSGLLDIGASLGQLRRARGLSQRELGERLGVKQQQVARWEASGYRNVALSRVSEAVEVLTPDTGDSACAGLSLPLAAESSAVYGAPVVPVRDLGEIVSRVRANATTLRECFGIISLTVFGSFARGEQTVHSDVDLLGDMEAVDMRSTIGAELWLEELLGRRVDLGRLSQMTEEDKARVSAEAVQVWRA